MKKYILLLFVIAFLINFSSCVKDAIIIKIPVAVTDTVAVHDTLVNFIPMDSGTVLFIVRHAETTGGGADPHLSIEGLDRADQLAFILQKNSLSGVYATNFFRTMETAAPTATASGLITTSYNSGDMQGFAIGLLNDNKGKKVLVVGHSNTTPQLLNILLDTNVWQTFNDTIYNNLFVVFKSDNDASVTHLKY